MESGNEAAFLVGVSVVFIAGHCCSWGRGGFLFILWMVLGLVGVIGESL